MTDILEELRSIDTGLISVDEMYRAQQIARRAAKEIERLQSLMGVERPGREDVARVLWDEAAQGGVTFETQERRYQVADAVLALSASPPAQAGQPQDRLAHTCGFHNRVREIPRPDICPECERQSRKDADGFVAAAPSPPNTPAPIVAEERPEAKP